MPRKPKIEFNANALINRCSIGGPYPDDGPILLNALKFATKFSLVPMETFIMGGYKEFLKQKAASAENEYNE